MKITMDYEQYEIACEKIRAANEQLLAEFAGWLRAAGLKEKTISNHVENMDFYLNEFLLYEDAVEAPAGVSEVNMFLGYWFIRKAMWASEGSIKSNAASLKKFYSWLAERGQVSAEELAELKETIKAEMPEWLATVRRYDDPEITDMEEVWGW